MPTPNNAIGIVGVDGHIPVYQPDARFAIWNISEIYKGEEGRNRFIPKENDLVVEPETGLIYIVTDLDPVTYIAELAPFNLRQDVNVHQLMSSTPDNYRIYYDKTTDPYTLNVDSFMHTYDPTASFARIYRGRDLDPTKIISRRYDNNGNFVGHDIPLTMVSFNSHDNYGVKSVPYANCTVELQDGEVCTVVLFTSNGKVTSKANCIVDETTYVAQAYAEQKYITQIFLKSVFVDTVHSGDINYPVNLPMPSFNPIGVVQYNDGSQVEYAVDGDKFNLFGLEQFTSTIVGHKVPLVLSYRMDPNEAALANVNTDSNFITRPYNLVVSEPNKSYNVKLFIYPEWIDEVSGYRYKAYLMNLDRSILYDVTSLLSITPNSPSFLPTTYGVTQRITFALDLGKIGHGYSTFIHVQTVDIVLRGAVNNDSLSNIWEVGSVVPSTSPYYGSGLRARLNQSSQKRVYVGNNIGTVDEFLRQTYERVEPIFNPVTETEPPRPTHIEVRYGDEVVFDKIENYDKEFSFSNDLDKYKNVDVIFYRESPNSYMKLAIVSMTIR